MTITFYSNYLNHHQVLVADSLYNLLGDNYKFVATLPRNEKELKGGADYSDRPYCILAGEDDVNKQTALELSISSDVCIFAANSQEYAVCRAKYNPNGLSFELAERWLKHGCLTIGSPVFRRWFFNYYRYYRKANFYKLCSGSHVASDDELLGAYKGRHYKWGYFTAVPDKIPTHENSTPLKLMWCARFLKLKHPELPIKMMAILKAMGYKLTLDYYGSGTEEKSTIELAKRLNLCDCVSFYGNMSNDKIIEAMKQHDVLLFTSNRFEGWGAVVNEAMANGCAVVSADCIGSTGYLIKDNITGWSFKGLSVPSLTKKVEYILNHKEEVHKVSRNAFYQMSSLWNPQNAVESLLTLISDLQNNKETSICEGPCSKAYNYAKAPSNKCNL